MDIARCARGIRHAWIEVYHKIMTSWTLYHSQRMIAFGIYCYRCLHLRFIRNCGFCYAVRGRIKLCDQMQNLRCRDESASTATIVVTSHFDSDHQQLYTSAHHRLRRIALLEQNLVGSMVFSADSDELDDYRAQALAHIRRESLDLYNRLHSIAEDVEFVNTVVNAYPDLPVLRESLLLTVHRLFPKGRP